MGDAGAGASLSVPADPALIGMQATVQGASINAVPQVFLSNALDIVVGG